jgi:hypothetical protein
MKPRTRRAVALVAAGSTAYLALRPRLLHWAATGDEVRRDLPGDDLVPGAEYSTTRAITIRARPADVWPWLVQMGQGRGGFYSYDWLENLRALDIHSADRIVSELQRLEVGDVIRVAPRVGLVVAVLEPERALVLRSVTDLETKRLPSPTDRGYFDWSWGFYLTELAEGGTRLVIRVRAATNPSPATRLLGAVFWEPSHFVMERRMLVGIKRRVEGAQGAGP